MSDLIWTGYENIDDTHFRATHVQEIGGILHANALDRQNSDENWNQSKDLKLGARVPVSVWFMWEQVGITKDDKLLKAALNRNPEYKVTEKEL